MATRTSFKQQCPSCEAMVPIKDASLVGRKIDCPKCKYRFVVEEPSKSVDDQEDDDLPAKKSDKKKPAAKNGVTAKRPLRDNAVGKAKARRPVPDEDDDDEPPQRRPAAKEAAAGNSTKLYLGLGLGVFGVLLLGITGWLLIASRKPKPTVQAAPAKQAAPTKALDVKVKEKPPAPVADITNLLPNKTDIVLNVPVHRLRSTQIGKAAFETPGAFRSDSLLQRLGIPEADIERVIIAGNFADDSLFFVVRTDKPILPKNVINALGLIPAEDSEKGHEYYVADSSWLGGASSLLKPKKPGSAAAGSRGAARKLLVRILDSQTMVLGGEPPMRDFLAAKEHPKNLYQPKDANKEKEKEKEKKEEENRPRPGGRFRPADRPGEFGGRETPAPAGKEAPSASYLTINPKLKAMMDRMESYQPSLVTLADDLENDQTETAQHLAKKVGLKLPAITIGAAVQMKEDDLNLIISAELNSEKAAVSWRNEVRRNIQGPLLYIAALLGIKRVEFDDLLVGVIGGNVVIDAPPGRGRRGGMAAVGELDANQDPNNAVDVRREREQARKAAEAALSAAAGDPAMIAELIRRLGPDAKFAENIPNRGSAKVSVKQQGKLVTLVIDCSLEAQAFQDMPALFGPIWIMVRGETEGILVGYPYVHGLGKAVKAYVDAHKEFPRGTLDRPADPTSSRVWPPDQRVSWLAELLPYLGQGIVRDKIDATKSWQDPVNFNSSVTLVPEFLNSSSPQDTWRVVYPRLHVPNYIGWDMPRAATHFVGMAGVGLDAAMYTPKDPPEVVKKMGVFGYDRATTFQDITDGLENTILMIQVPPPYQGPWIAGGGSTVRGVPETNSIRPFVSTSYEGRRGTFAIMCDGTVRFIPETISDQNFKAMCTIKGGETVDLELEAPRVKELKADAQASLTTGGGGPRPRRMGGIASDTDPTNGDANAWQMFTSDDWKFAVLFPGKPEQHAQPVKFPQGDINADVFAAARPTAREAYVVMCMNAPAGSANTILDGMDKIPLGGKVSDQHAIDLEGNPGRELTLELAGGMYIRMRVFVARQKVYMVMMTASQPAVTGRTATKFFESFKFLN